MSDNELANKLTEIALSILEQIPENANILFNDKITDAYNLLNDAISLMRHLIDEN